MDDLNQKINQHFPGLVVRKDLVKAVKGNAIVPTYVLEYLLGQYCATNDEATIQGGIETVKEILRKHYVNRSEAGLIRSTIRERGRHRVIDKISVALNEKTDCYEAEFSNLGIKKVLVDSSTVKAHPKLLVSGVWCIADIEYDHNEDPKSVPWTLATLKPIQLSKFDFDSYASARSQFTTDEWIDLLVQSIGFNPVLFGRRSKLTLLIRLIPFCERNYNLIELGPKGTGKSHLYSEFSPHGILISGGEISVPKLFVNNASGKIGLVGYWDVVAFDEFAGKTKKVDNALVDIMKNYMANKSFSRGIETLGAEVSMVFVGNTQHTVPYMLKHSDLFDELPAKYYDSAFLDRIHFYLPGWEMDVIRGEMFSSDYGFVVDYLAEILRFLRSHDYSNRYQEQFTLSSDLSTRDRDGIHKTFSGLMKILFPQGEASPAEIREILHCAIEGRARVKDQLMRIDSTYPSVSFVFTETASGRKTEVTPLEGLEYPRYYQRKNQAEAEETGDGDELPVTPVSWPKPAAAVASSALPGAPPSAVPAAATVAKPAEPPVPSAETVKPAEPQLKAMHVTIQENQRNISYDRLFGKYLKGASQITVTDPYIRAFFQIRNLMEFLETVVKSKSREDEVAVHLITGLDDYNPEKQADHFRRIQESCQAVGIAFTWEFDKSGTIHARHIVTDTGWKISLDRGLDIFQPYDMNDALAFANRLQTYRPCKSFEMTFIRINHG